jgi:hypothetical protein
MPSIDLSSMQPGDAAVALRTLPRRYRDAARTASTTDLDPDGGADEAAIDEVAARVGPDGHSAADVVAAAAAHVALLDRTLRSALVSDAVVVPRRLGEDAPTVTRADGGRGFGDAVDELGRGCTALAEVVDGADPTRWTAPIATESGGTTTPLQVLQKGVAVLVGWERELAPFLRAVRGRQS